MDKATMDGYSSVGYHDEPSRYDPGRKCVEPSITVSSMFEAPSSNRIGIDHNECLTRAVNYLFPDDENGTTPRIDGAKYGYRCVYHALRLGLVLVENKNGWIECVNAVAAGGYKPDWRINFYSYGVPGWTAAHYAAFNGNKEALLLLLSCDWSYDLPGKDGRTVLDILKDEGYDDLYNYVKNKYANKLNDYERKKQLRKRLKREKDRFENTRKIYYDEYGRGMTI